MHTEVACLSSVSLWKQKATCYALPVASAQLWLFLREECCPSHFIINKVTHSEENGRAVPGDSPSYQPSPFKLLIPITSQALSFLLLRNRNVSKIPKS